MKKIIRVPVSSEPPRIDNRYGYETVVYGCPESIRPDISLKSLISELNLIQKKYRDRFQDMEFESIRDCGCRYDCNCSPSYVLYGKRYETQVEYEFRLKKEETEKQYREERDRKEFDRLKAQFGEK